MTAQEVYAPRWIETGDMPAALHSEILPGLWVGGTADDGWIDRSAPCGGFGDAAPYDAVVTLFAWAQPMSWGVEELRYGFGDAALDDASLPKILAAARWAHERWSRGERVLVRCQAGINRSGLVAALVLMIAGYSAHEAIQLLRQGRSPFALCNDAFVDWLLTQAGRSIDKAPLRRA